MPVFYNVENAVAGQPFAGAKAADLAAIEAAEAGIEGAKPEISPVVLVNGLNAVAA